MSKTKKLLQACPICSYQYKPNDYLKQSAICKDCHKSSPKFIKEPSFYYRFRHLIVASILLIGCANFSFLIYKNWDRFTKKDTRTSTYIKHYWDDFKEENLISIIQTCIKKNDFQCQMLAYKRLTEIDPSSEFYRKGYEAKLKKYKNPPKLDYTLESY